MTASTPFEWMIGIGALVALLSMGRATVIELSDRATAVGWLILGVGVLGWAATTRLEAGSAWEELVWLIRLAAALIGGGFALLGLRRLGRASDIELGTARDSRHDLASQLDRTAPDDARKKSAWRMVYAGGAVVLILFAVANVWGGTIDGSPESLVFLFFLVLGFALVTVGRWRLLRLLREQGGDGRRSS